MLEPAISITVTEISNMRFSQILDWTNWLSTVNFNFFYERLFIFIMFYKITRTQVLWF